MLVSILTPSLNQVRWLPDNLASVARQTYDSIEHVVIDGGSTDGTAELLAATTWPGVRWTSEPDRGQSHALNKALAVSSGEIIGWVNADDGYVDRRSVERAVACFLRYPEVDVVYGHSLMVGPTNTVLQVLWAPPYFRRLTRYVTPFFQPAVFFRRTVLDALFVDEALHFVMDFDLWRRLWPVARFRRIPLFVGLERHQPDRKVYSEAYRLERAEYFAEHVPDRDRFANRMVRSSYAVAERAVGIPTAERARRSIEPAIDLQWPDSRRLWRTQLVLDRASLPID